MNWVYIIKCGDNSLYTGWTNNLENRFKMHVIGKGAKYTRGRGPLELVYFEEYEDKILAMRREWEIKKMKKKEKEKLIEEFNLKNNNI